MIRININTQTIQRHLFKRSIVTSFSSSSSSSSLFLGNNNATKGNSSSFSSGLIAGGGYQQRLFSSGSNSWNWTKSTSSTSSTQSSETKEASSSSSSFSSSSSPSPDQESIIDPSIQSTIMSKCTSLHTTIMPLNDKLRGPLAKHSDKATSLPFVFLVGNHSSGKSSFINYVLGRDVQTAGVAPTDDCFTVIAPGPNDSDQDGPALVGDPDMGFSQLRQFGPTLIHHTQLKVRSGTNTTSFMMIDSPGMIDSPMSQSGMGSSATTTSSGSQMDRGYDFQGVVRWYAERADVVMLFFDPDKPGTTGETLSVLLHSLGGMDHKLLIVLNKADQFKKVRFVCLFICRKNDGNYFFNLMFL